MPHIRLLTAILLASLFYCLPAAAEKRVALVVGNSAYVHATPLTNPANDASDMAEALKRVGFEVILGLDVDRRTFDGKLRDFARALDGADVALLFYAGHGLQIAGQNYLVPIDAALAGERDLDFEAVNVDFIVKQMEIDRASKTNIVFLDACRDNPLARNLARSMGTRSAGIGRGLAQVQTGVGTFIAYSTQPGNVALDGAGRNSPFAAALTRRISEPGRNLTSVMIDVRKDVLTATAGKQVPWDHSALTGEFYFDLAAAPGLVGRKAVDNPADTNVQQRLRELEAELKQKNDPQRTEKVVELAEARSRLRQLQEANRADQQKIFDIQYSSTRSTETTSASTTAMEVGGVQMRMARRSQEMKALRERISVLEGELGISAASAPAAQ